MAELKQTFTDGFMDLGSDARLIKNGTIRYAVNIDVAGSESSDQGVIQNIRGNTARGHDLEIPTDNPIVIGAASNESQSRIYYFWVSQFSEGIYEYDVSDINTTTGSGTLNRILEFTKTDSSSHSFLNFQENQLITGAVVVNDLLIWTDGVNPVRKINIDRFRGSGNYITCPLTDENAYDCPEGSITRENPRNAGEQQFLQSQPNPLYDGNGDVLIDTETETLVDEIPKSNEFSTDLINLAKRPPLFPPTITKIVPGTDDATYEARGSKPEDKLYDTLARFSIRYRYTDGETSALSPFSAAAFMPKNYSINSDTGVMESMTNFMEEVEITFDVGENEVKEIDIVYKESDSSAVYIVDTINKEASDIQSSTKSVRRYFRYTYDGSKVYRLLPSSELARIYDNVPIKAKALDMAGNRLVLGNYVENYTFTRHSEDGAEITPNYEVDYIALDRSAEHQRNSPFRSCKTGRDYQIGVVYLDRNGRQSPVIVSNDNTVHIPFNETQHRTRLTLTIKSEAPYWATHYRPFVKQNKGVFYNIIPPYSKYLWQDDIDGDGANDDVNKFYLRIQDADINKIAVGDVLVRKVSLGNVVDEVQYWRVNETKRFVARNTQTFEDNKLPSSIPNNQTGYYAILAPTDNNYDLPAGETDLVDPNSVWETVPEDIVGDFFWETSETYRIVNGRHTNAKEEVPRADADIQLLDANGAAVEGVAGEVTIELDWFNCYGYGVGVESMVVEDRFNGRTLDQGARASTVQEDFRQANKESWIIHSGVYSDSTNLNRLNEFNVSLPLQKELDINDGSVQKLHFRDTNLYVFQERKVKNVPINKNVIVTADGGNLSTAGSQFFGTERAYAGNYGISQNPESFATYGGRIYFADKNRGAILRLSQDGITEISKNGVEAYVRRYIAAAHFIKLSYNDYADELDISFQNPNVLQPYNGNRRQRRISAVGLPDPQYACTVRYRGLDFETIHAVMHDAGGFEDYDGTFQAGDTIYVDEDNNTPFRGDYRWFRVETGSGADASYDQAIQISDDGVVAAAVSSCRNDYPKVIAHKSFNVSTESFQTELDACANGVLDQIAYFGPGRDQVSTSSEPQEGNIIYEASNTLIRSSRNGWHKINVAEVVDGNITYEHYVVLIRNGVVVKTFHCDRIEQGRVRFTGSNVLNIVANETSFDRNIRICTSNLDQGWWLANDRELPLIGDTVYENNFTEDTAPQGYLATANGNYFVINANGVVTEIGSCGEVICTNEPNTYMVPNSEVPIQSDIALTYNSQTSNSVTFDIDSSIGDLKLNDYYETDSEGNVQYRIGGVSSGATCDVGDANCLPVILNDVTDDADTFENNDLVSVSISVTEDGTTSRYNLYGRVEIDSGNYSLVVDNTSEILPADSDLTYALSGINNNYKYEFLGLEITTTINSVETEVKIGLPKMEVKWFEKGVKRYPSSGLYNTTLLNIEAGRKYKLTNTAVPDELVVSSVISELCYDQVTGGDESYVFIFNTGTTEATASTRCGQKTNTTLYYNPDITPKVYYTNASLAQSTLFDGSNLYFGIAYDNGSNAEDNASTVRVEQIGDDGVVVSTSTINCAYPETQTLSYVPPDTTADDPEGLACMLYDDGTTQSYWSDGSDFTPDNDNSDLATNLIIQDGTFNFAPDGWYSDNDVVRQMVGGVLSTETTSCATPLTSTNFTFSAASALHSCGQSANTAIFSTQSTLSSETRLYSDAYRTEYFSSGYYSDTNNVGYWNKQLGDFETFGSCTIEDNIDFYDPLEAITDPIITYNPDSPDNQTPIPTQFRVENKFYYSASEVNVCSSADREFKVVYSDTDSPYDDSIYTTERGSTLAPAGYYYFQSAKVYRQWTGTAWSGGDTECVTNEPRPANIVIFGGNLTQVCGTGATEYQAYFNGPFNSSALTGGKFYTSGTGDDVLLDGNHGFFANGDRSLYRSWNGQTEVLGAPIACPEQEPEVQLYTYSPELGFADSKNQACINASGDITNPRYLNSNSLAGATEIYNYPYNNNGTQQADYVRADKGWYAQGTIALQWNGSTVVGSPAACNTAHIVIDDVKYGTSYSIRYYRGAAILEGQVVVDTVTPLNIALTADITIDPGCNARSRGGNYIWDERVGDSTLMGTFNGQTLTNIAGEIAWGRCTPSQNSISVSLGPQPSGTYDFSLTLDNGDWFLAGQGATIRVGLNGL